MTHVQIPVVSVILPVFNAMPYLTRTLESILAQDLTAFELIAIDDGSTDGSASELDRCALIDDRVRVLHQANSGWPGMPRNRGLDVARGLFVLCMDADDTLAPQALSMMVAMADHRDADVVIPRFEGVGGRAVQSLFRRSVPGDIGLGRALETLSPQKLIRRSLIEQNGLRFPEGEVRLEDGIFITEAYLLARRIAFCGREPLYFIALRSDGQNISRRPIDPSMYVASCRRIADLLRTGVPDRERAELLILQFFTRKGLRFYEPHRWQLMDRERKETWLRLHRAFLEEFVPEEEDARIPGPNQRRMLTAIRHGAVPEIDALVLDEVRLAQTSHFLGGHTRGTVTELKIAVDPAESATLLSPSQFPRPWRLRLASGITNVARPFFGAKFVRGTSRRVSSFASGPSPSASLLLSGRRTRKTSTIPGRLAKVDRMTGELHFRFVVPSSVLQRFRGERVDVWAVAGSGAETRGRRSRVQSGHVDDSLGDLLYTTDRGNLSLDLRTSAEPERPQDPQLDQLDRTSMA